MDASGRRHLQSIVSGYEDSLVHLLSVKKCLVEVNAFSIVIGFWPVHVKIGYKLNLEMP